MMPVKKKVYELHMERMKAERLQEPLNLANAALVGEVEDRERLAGERYDARRDRLYLIGALETVMGDAGEPLARYSQSEWDAGLIAGRKLVAEVRARIKKEKS